MGSRNKNTGENRSKRMANELNLAGSQVARGTSLHGTNQAFDKALRDEVKKGRKVAGTNIRHGFNALKNIDPNRLSDFRGGTKYSGDTAGTVNAQELREIGLERDKLANQRTYAGDQLGALESGNRFLGLNPTSGMGIMQSLKRNFTNPEAQRSYANTRNIGRTLANMGPIGGILRGLSNSLFGTDLRPMQMEGMPMGNIDPREAGFFGAAQGAPNTAFGYTESPLNMETYSPDYIADRLFNTYTAPAADPIRQPVFTGEQTTEQPQQYSINAFMNPHQLDGNYNLYDAMRENLELANKGQTRFNYDMDGDGVVTPKDLGISDQVLNQNNILGTAIDSDSALGDLYGKTLMSDGYVPMYLRNYVDPNAGQTTTEFVPSYMGAEPAVVTSDQDPAILQNVPGDALNYDAGNQGLDFNNINLGTGQNLGSFGIFQGASNDMQNNIFRNAFQ